MEREVETLDNAIFSLVINFFPSGRQAEGECPQSYLILACISSQHGSLLTTSYLLTLSEEWRTLLCSQVPSQA